MADSLTLMFNGKKIGAPVVSPRAVDGNPVGTVISFMGTSAPADYLVCDGAVYDITAYPSLANFIGDQFGAVNYFGGDGTATFAVPDLRNMFLRGYHGDKSEKLSGEIGVAQDGTYLCNYAVGDVGNVNFFTDDITKAHYGRYPDKVDGWARYGRYIEAETKSWTENAPDCPNLFTTRPVNVAVLFCIKAVDSQYLQENQYSTQEKRIGTWIDGKPLYRCVFTSTPASSGNGVVLHGTFTADHNVSEYVKIDGRLLTNDGLSLPCTYSDICYVFSTPQGISANILSNVYIGSPVLVTVDYTKTADTQISGESATMPAQKVLTSKVPPKTQGTAVIDGEEVECKIPGNTAVASASATRFAYSFASASASAAKIKI